MFRNFLTIIFVVTVLYPINLFADEATDSSSNDAKAELVAKLHENWGVHNEVAKLVDAIASKLPAEQQAVFKEQMSKTLDVDQIKASSMETAANIFNEEELQAMVSYYSSPVGKTAEEKKVAYEQALMPKVKPMIEKGMMEATSFMLQQGQSAQ